MDSFDEKASNESKATADNVSGQTSVVRAKNLARTFQSLDRGYHRLLHKNLAEAAELYVEFKIDLFSYAIFMGERYEPTHGNNSRELVTSHDLLYALTGAKSREARRIAGTYARVVDFMTGQGLNNYESSLNRHGGYTGVLKAARQKSRPSRPHSDEKPYIKVYLDPGHWQRLATIRENCSRKVEFALDCSAGPGRNSQVIAYMWLITKENQLPLTGQERGLLKLRFERGLAAEADLRDRTERSLKGRAVKSRG